MLRQFSVTGNGDDINVQYDSEWSCKNPLLQLLVLLNNTTRHGEGGGGAVGESDDYY